METVTELAPIIADIGIPALFFIVVLYGILKWIPYLIEERKAQKEYAAEQSRLDREEIQRSWNERQRAYEAQTEMINGAMQTIIKVAESSAAVIDRNNAVVEMNTEMGRNTTESYKDVRTTLQMQTKVLDTLISDMKSHDDRAEHIASDIKVLKNLKT